MIMDRHVSAPRRSRTVAVLTLAGLLWLVGAVRAEPPRSPLVDDAEIERRLRVEYTESEQVRLVLLPTTVTDRRGRPVLGLGPDDFVLFEDHQQQAIRFVGRGDTEPLSLAFLLDLSGSMRFLGKLEQTKRTIRWLVDQLGPADQVALIGFADRQVAWITDFTDDREHFLRRLEVQEGFGQTALNDAVAAAPGLVDSAVRGRRALVLFTDGIDNASTLSITAAVALARRVNLPVYAMGFQSSVDPRQASDPNSGTDLDVLRRIATETGGRLFLVDDPADLAAASELLAAELRHQYVIGYYPTQRGGAGRFHAVRLELKDRRLSARTRSGYVTTATP